MNELSIDTILEKLNHKPLEEGKEYPYLALKQGEPTLYVMEWYINRSYGKDDYDLDFIQLPAGKIEELVEKAVASATKEATLVTPGQRYVHKETWHPTLYRYEGEPAKMIDVSVELYLKLGDDKPEFLLRYSSL